MGFFRYNPKSKWKVDALYFVNTLGAAVGAYFAAAVLLGSLGLSGTVHATAGLNAWLGLAVFGLASLERPMPASSSSA